MGAGHPRNCLFFFFLSCSSFLLVLVGFTHARASASDDFSRVGDLLVISQLVLGIEGLIAQCTGHHWFCHFRPPSCVLALRHDRSFRPPTGGKFCHLTRAPQATTSGTHCNVKDICRTSFGEPAEYSKPRIRVTEI